MLEDIVFMKINFRKIGYYLFITIIVINIIYNGINLIMAIAAGNRFSS
jgi:hypothetical protein